MTDTTTNIPSPDTQVEAFAATPPARNPIPAGGRIMPIVPTSFEDVLRMAAVLARAGDMVPEAYRGKPDTIAAAITRGLDLQLPPMQALQTIAVVKGKTMLWGDGLKALLFRAGFWVESGVEGSADQMVGWAKITRPDNGQIIERTFSWQDAKRAGLLTKDNYQNYPQRMFQARALAWAAKDGAPDVMMGFAVVEDEAGLLPGQEMRVVGGADTGAVTGLAAVVARRQEASHKEAMADIRVHQDDAEETSDPALDD